MLVITQKQHKYTQTQRHTNNKFIITIVKLLHQQIWLGLVWLVCVALKVKRDFTLDPSNALMPYNNLRVYACMCACMCVWVVNRPGLLIVWSLSQHSQSYWSLILTFRSIALPHICCCCYFYCPIVLLLWKLFAFSPSAKAEIVWQISYISVLIPVMCVHDL